MKKKYKILEQTLSPKESAMPWLLARILMWPIIGPDGSCGFAFSIETFAKASSPNMEWAQRFAAKKPQSPS